MPTRREFLAASASLTAFPALVRAADAPSGLVNGQKEGAEAGNKMLADGGNAVDAIVTAAFVAGVVALPSTGLGGYGGHVIIARPDGSVSAIDFNGFAPLAARRDMYEVNGDGTVKDRANAIGWKAAGVPGVLAGLQMALDHFGTRKLPDVLPPAIKFAEDGFPISKPIAAAILKAKDQFAKDPGSAKLYLRSGKPLSEGDTFRNRELADMLGTFAAKGRVDDFYTGPIAKTVAAAFQANGGLVTEADLAAYKPKEVKPLKTDWGEFSIHTPPPTAGGLTILQTLRSMIALDWKNASDAKSVHALVEALRIAWAYRLTSLGDPDFGNIPIPRLLSNEQARTSADRVRTAVEAGKTVDLPAAQDPDKGTIHLNAVDKNGMLASLTFTHGEAFGAQVTVDALGLTLGHGMSRFDPRPGRPNSIIPRKRPLHNMCPTVVTRGGKPMLTIGATGGRRIPNTVLMVLIRRLIEGQDLAAAVKSPRLQTEGDTKLVLEAGWPEAVVERMKAVGYAVSTGPGANLSAIERIGVGTLTAAAR